MKLLTKRMLTGFALVLGIAIILALWQPWRSDVASDAGWGVIQTVGWSDDVLRLSGQAAPNSNVTAEIEGKSFAATSDGNGAFTIEAKITEHYPLRAQLAAGEQKFDLLLTRWQRRWLLLQRTPGALPWQPGVGFTVSSSPGIVALAKTRDGYGVTFTVPPALTSGVDTGNVYVYADGRLIFTQPKTERFIQLTVPADVQQLRLDLYDADAAPAARARLNLPPGDYSTRYALSEGELWLFTDLAPQQQSADDLLPGQFIPIKPGEEDFKASVPAKAAALKEKDAPPARIPPLL